MRTPHPPRAHADLRRRVVRREPGGERDHPRGDVPGRQQPGPDAVPGITEVNVGAGVEWLFSFLSADKRKTYCLYEAPNPEAIREAARKLNIPADVIVELGEFRMTPGAPELFTPARGA